MSYYCMVHYNVCNDKGNWHQTDTACAWLVCHSQEGMCKLYPPILPIRRPGLPFFWEASYATPQHGWQRYSSLRETLSPIQDNKLIQQFAPKISPSELSLHRETRRTLAQLRTNKNPILISYLHKVDETHYPSPLCKTHPHTCSTAHT